MKERLIKDVWNMASILCVVVTIILISITIGFRKSSSSLPSVAGYIPMTVLSGSMRPMLKPGDMIIVKKIYPKEVEVGDVITFMVDDTLVTHRVIDVLEYYGQPAFRTKGDANSVEDRRLILSDQLVGLLVFTIPKLGYVLAFIRSPIGILIFLILPTAATLFLEVKDLLSQVGRNKKTGANPGDNGL